MSVLISFLDLLSYIQSERPLLRRYHSFYMYQNSYISIPKSTYLHPISFLLNHGV